MLVKKIIMTENITNKNRTFGALLSNHIARDKAFERNINKRGGLRIHCNGVGGLSFGMGLPRKGRTSCEWSSQSRRWQGSQWWYNYRSSHGGSSWLRGWKGHLDYKGRLVTVLQYAAELDVLAETTGDMSSCYRTGGNFCFGAS